MKKIAIGSLLQETNTFSANKTRMDDFNFFYGNDFLKKSCEEKTEVKGFINILKKENLKIVPLMGGWAVSSGRIIKKDFNSIINNFATLVKKEKKLDGILLALHGACVAENCDSVDSYLIERLRKIVGKKLPIIITLDLHANITKSM